MMMDPKRQGTLEFCKISHYAMSSLYSMEILSEISLCKSIWLRDAELMQSKANLKPRMGANRRTISCKQQEPPHRARA